VSVPSGQEYGLTEIEQAHAITVRAS
jgi:hypothetical protein